MNPPRRKRLILLAAVCLLTPATQAQGPKSEEPRKLALDQPYLVKVVLDVAKHRLLTPVFKEQVKRELQDGLRAAFGDMARVNVVEQHVRLDAIRRDGLQTVLDGMRNLGFGKTHFVLIDFADGQYEVQARQHDGLTGLASPTVRRERISDRQFVSRLATFLVARDFGLVGQVTPVKGTKTATVAFKGVALAGPASRWISKGDVLLIVSVIGGTSARKSADAVLIVDEFDEKGNCKCRVFNRFTDALGGSDLRCLRVHTIKAPLRVELVSKEGGGRAPNISVTVRKHGFDGEEGTKLETRTDNEGFLSTEKDRVAGEFDRIGFLTVKVEPKQALVPLPIVDERPIKVVVSTRPPGGGDVLRVKKELWDREVYELGLVVQDLFQELKKMESKPAERQKAIGRAKEGLEHSRGMLKELRTEREALIKEARGAGATLEMAFGDGWIRFLDNSNTQLEKYLADQEKVIKEENDPKRLAFKTLLQQAKREEGAGEFEKALELYEEAMRSPFSDADLKKEYDKLKGRWTPKNEEHRKARFYLEKDWATTDLLATPGAMAEAEKAFDVYRANIDVLGAVKVRQLILGQGGKLKAKKDTLEPDINEEDRKAVQMIADLAAALRKFGNTVEAFIQDKSK